MNRDSEWRCLVVLHRCRPLPCGAPIWPGRVSTADRDEASRPNLAWRSSARSSGCSPPRVFAAYFFVQAFLAGLLARRREDWWAVAGFVGIGLMMATVTIFGLPL